MKTSELTGAALDWAVAKCEGAKAAPLKAGGPMHLFLEVGFSPLPYSPSTDWEHGGPIIEQEGINLTMFVEGEVDPEDVGSWCAAYDRDNFGDDEKSCTASTPLVAAMRCFCASRLGDEVDVPEELK